MDSVAIGPSKETLAQLERGFVRVALLFFLSSPLKLLELSEATESYQAGTNILEQLSYLIIHLIALTLLIAHRKRVYAELMKRDKLILFSLTVLLMAVIFSALWSAYPDVTIRRAVALWGTTFFGIYFATCYSFEEQFSFLLRTFGIVAVLSLVLVLCFPSYGIMSGTHAGAWRGVFLHKNGLGSSMVLSCVMFMMQALSSSSYRKLSLFLLGLSFFLLLLSNSKNALLIVLILLSLIPILSLLKLRLELMIPALLGVTSLITLVVLGIIENLKTLLQFLGKDLTLTGRTDIWPYVWEAAEKKIWLGYGYQGFWQGFDSEAAKIWYTVGWEPSHPHNGLLELLLIFGFVLTVLFLLVFIWLYVRSIALIQVTHSAKYFLAFIFLTYTFIANLGETKVLEYNDISWVLYILVALLVAQPFYGGKAFQVTS